MERIDGGPAADDLRRRRRRRWTSCTSRTSPARTSWRRRRRCHRRGVQHGQRARRRAARAVPTRCCGTMGSTLEPEYVPRRGRSTRCRAGWPTPGKARELLGFEAGVGLEEGLRRLVAGGGEHADSVRVSASTDAMPMIPIARPLHRRGRGRGRAAAPSCSGWVTQGPEVAAFEREFAAFVGAPHACAVSNCTTALHLALLAVGVGPGDEVITVSHSFIATANAIRYCGAMPVFVDIEPDTFNIDPARIEARDHAAHARRSCACTRSACPATWRRIVEIARRHGLPVIEDAACAAAARSAGTARWERIGRPHGDIACFSFHPRKVHHHRRRRHAHDRATPSGTRSFRLLAPARHERARHRAARRRARSSSRRIPSVGFNYRLTDIQAAVGREQLKRLPGIVERRRASWPAATASCWPACRPRAAGRAGVGAHATGRATACGCPRALDQRAVMQRCSTTASPRAAASCARIAKRPTRRAPGPAIPAPEPARAGPPGAGTSGRASWPRTTRSSFRSYHQMTEAEQDRVIACRPDDLRVLTGRGRAACRRRSGG